MSVPAARTRQSGALKKYLFDDDLWKGLANYLNPSFQGKIKTCQGRMHLAG